MKYLPFIQNKLWGIVDSDMNIIIEPQYKIINTDGDYPNNFFKVIENNRYFYININNEIVSDKVLIINDNFINAKYKTKKNFLFSICKDNKSVFYDYFGKRAFNKVFDYDEHHTVFENSHTIVKINGKSGAIDRKGNFILEPIYDHIEYYYMDNYFITKLNKSKKLFNITNNRFLSLNGEEIQISEKYLFIKNNGYYTIFSHLEVKQSDILYEEIECFYDDVIIARIKGKYGMINNDFYTILEFVYELIYHNEDINKTFVFLDKNWIVLDDIYNSIFSSKQNYIEREWWEMDFNYIDSLDGYTEQHDDKILFHTADYIQEYKGYDKLYPVLDKKYIAAIERNDKYGFINLKTDFIQDSIFDDMSNSLDYKNYIAISKDNKWGIIDFDGKYLVENIFTNITSKYDDSFYIMLKHLIGVDLNILKSYLGCILCYNYIVTYNYEQTYIFLLENKQIRHKAVILC